MTNASSTNFPYGPRLPEVKQLLSRACLRAMCLSHTAAPRPRLSDNPSAHLLCLLDSRQRVGLISLLQALLQAVVHAAHRKQSREAANCTAEHLLHACTGPLRK